MDHYRFEYLFRKKMNIHVRVFSVKLANDSKASSINSKNHSFKPRRIDRFFGRSVNTIVIRQKTAFAYGEKSSVTEIE